MKFSGLEAISCQCVKIVQQEDQYKVVVYKERLTAKDSGTWNLTISVKDDQTQPFVKPNEYEQKIQINFKESVVVETNTTDAAAESAANETSEADNSTETKEESATETAVASPTVDVKKVETKKFVVDTKKFKPNFKFNPNKVVRKQKKARLPVILKLKKISRSGKITINFNQKLKIPKKFRKRLRKRKLQSGKDDIFEISVGNKLGEKHEFVHEITEWNEAGVVVQIDFDNPIAISQNQLHLAKIVVKKPEIFEAESGEKLKQIGTDQLHFVKLVPK